MADGENIFYNFTRLSPRRVSQADARHASHDLVEHHSEWSCSSKVRHRSGLVMFSVLAGCFGLLQPHLFLMLANIGGTALFTVLISMRATLVVRGGWLRFASRKQDKAPAVKISHWPRCSVLVPLYKEAGSIPKLSKGLLGLDYPLDKLEVLFLLEEDDAQTLEALQETDLPPHWSVLILPEGEPRTKPRALNVALGVLTGEIATIYDAEDYPRPDQLKTAIAALHAGGETMACVQAPLKAYNARASWVAGQWALEYDTHFGLILPALAEAGRPIALGGTSNHFRVSALRAAGGWDAWNVTEDADLGLRLARLGYRIGTIKPPTLEEAPERFSVWYPQRSRWIKGYMQSASVIWRRPGLAISQMGGGSFMASQVLLGGAIFSAVLHGPFAMLCLVCVLVPGFSLSPIAIALFLSGGLVNAVAAFLAPGKKGLRRLFLVATAPLYWPLQSIAAMRALYELATTPHIWSKTPHALARTDLFQEGLAHI